MKEIMHLKKRFASKRFNVNDDDVKALNGIIKHVNETQNATLNRNKLFIKLFLSNFLDETVISGKSAHEALEEIKRLLSIPMSEYYEKMREQVPLMRLEKLADKKGVMRLYTKKGAKNIFNSYETRAKHNEPIFKKYKREMELALTTDYTKEELDVFIKNTLFKLLTDEKNLQ